MFGLPFLGGGIFDLLPLYGIFFVINLVLQLVTGGLDALFVPPDDLN